MEAAARRLALLSRQSRVTRTGARAPKGGLRGEAAVLVALFERHGEPHVWLTRRHAALSTHAGEVSLPGGRRDPGDANATAAALREADEEIALERTLPVVLATLAPAVSKHGLLVTPVVAQVPPAFVPRPNADEVECAFALPLSTFLSADAHEARPIVWRGSPMLTHTFIRTPAADLVHGEATQTGAETVWGLTAHLCVDVARAALGRDPEFPAEPS